MRRLSWFSNILVSLGTAMIGHTIHHSLFWALVDFAFWPIAWVKWLICHQVTLSVIKRTFGFFLS
jgi:hypothetical protein